MRICFKGSCNNDCLFCKEDKAHNCSDTYIREQAESINTCTDKRIIFTGTDPTLQKNIFGLLGLAKERKIEIRQLNTNGRMLSNIEFSKRIITTGANYFKISLHGHNERLHDKITRSKGSFRQTMKGIKNLLKLGQRDNIVLSVTVCSLNEKYLYNIMKLAKRFKIKKAQLNVVRTDNHNLLPSLDELAKRIAIIRERFLFDIIIKAKGIPYCLIFSPESLFLKDVHSEDYIFPDECRQCKYNTICSGVMNSYLKYMPSIKTIPDMPVEVMLEVESRCNFKCTFCFNRTSFASNGFGIQHMTTKYVKEIIDSIKKAKVPTVRFTGGEPMLREDFFDLIRYAKSKGLKVRLNTNGSLIEDYNMVKELVKNLDYVLFAMHAYTAKQDEMITGFKNSFDKKIRAMQWFKKAGINILRVNTIASLDNIGNLDKFYRLFKKIKVDRWAVNRLIPISKEDNDWGKKEAVLLISKLAKIKKDNMKRKIPMWIHIVNAVPLCAADPVMTSAVSSGGRAVDGHERFAIDPRGFAKPIYYMDENIGSPLDILKCWNNPFMRSIRNYEILPKECRECPLLDRCKGGNRYCARIANNYYEAADPLMDFSKISKYIW
jgi:MoaA/NifB/PqqE/SkfB family radical SAM enzyme